jgi:hypothetical protein
MEELGCAYARRESLAGDFVSGIEHAEEKLVEKMRSKR